MVRIVVTGELDMATAPVLAELLAGAQTDGAEATILDLRDVNFVDVAGVRVFVGAYRRAGLLGRRFVLVGADPSTRRLFELTGAGFLLDGDHAVTAVARFARRDGTDG